MFYAIQWVTLIGQFDKLKKHPMAAGTRRSQHLLHLLNSDIFVQSYYRINYVTSSSVAGILL